MIDINEIISTIGRAKNNETSLDLLLSIEGILDELDVYAYENWIQGEVIRGPVISKYWIEIYLMYPEKLMPNPEAAARLVKRGCHVFFKKDILTTTVKIKKEDDITTREIAGRERRVPDTKETPVYVVKIVVPRHLLKEVNQNLIAGIDNDNIDLDDLMNAYDQGLDVSTSIENASSDTKEKEQNGEAKEFGDE